MSTHKIDCKCPFCRPSNKQPRVAKQMNLLSKNSNSITFTQLLDNIRIMAKRGLTSYVIKDLDNETMQLLQENGFIIEEKIPYNSKFTVINWEDVK